MKPFIALLVLLATAAASPAHAQTLCTLRVLQDQQEVPATFIGGVRKYTLKPTPFSLEVAPAHCAPTIVTAPSLAIAREIGEKPLIYSRRLLYLVATLPEQSGDLLWAIPHRLTPDERLSPDPGTFTGKQYLKLCDELRFCPKPFPIYSSGQPFAADDIGSKSRATFTRLDAARPLQALKDQQILNIVPITSTAAMTFWLNWPTKG